MMHHASRHSIRCPGDHPADVMFAGVVCVGVHARITPKGCICSQHNGHGRLRHPVCCRSAWLMPHLLSTAPVLLLTSSSTCVTSCPATSILLLQVSSSAASLHMHMLLSRVLHNHSHPSKTAVLGYELCQQVQPSRCSCAVSAVYGACAACLLVAHLCACSTSLSSRWLWSSSACSLFSVSKQGTVATSAAAGAARSGLCCEEDDVLVELGAPAWQQLDVRALSNG